MIDILPGIRSSASALNAERIRMDVISQNIAHANSTARGPDGNPYQRQQVVFESALAGARASFGSHAPQSVLMARITEDHRPPIAIHNPGHPDADANGYVAKPDISVPNEMVDLISASRAFEANLAVIKHARSMAIQTLGIGKR